MSSSLKTGLPWLTGGVAIGFMLNWLYDRFIKNDKTGSEGQILDVIFTNDQTEKETIKGVHYLELSNMRDFTPRNMARILEIINSAQHTIDAAVYLFNVKMLGDAMIRAHERGVTVRVLGCKSMAGATGTQFPDMTKAGIQVIFKQTSMCMHHKFCLIDTRPQTEVQQQEAAKRKKRYEERLKIRQKKQQALPEAERQTVPKEKTITIPAGGICITGSCNWTMQGFAGNWENIIITSHPKIVAPFRREFDRIWDDFIEAQSRNGEAVVY